MDIQNLIKMANQIGAFFAAMPDSKQALADMASHIKRSWEVRMIHQLQAHILKAGDQELSPFVRKALAEHFSPHT